MVLGDTCGQIRSGGPKLKYWLPDASFQNNNFFITLFREHCDLGWWRASQLVVYFQNVVDHFVGGTVEWLPE